MFREMFLVTGLAKYKEKDASAVDAYEVLKMATVNAAKATAKPRMLSVLARRKRLSKQIVIQSTDFHILSFVYAIIYSSVLYFRRFRLTFR